MQPRLTRSRTDRMIGGVCGGLGHYFGVDPVIVRLIFVVIAVTTFITVILYPILWLVMPEERAPHAHSMPLPPDARFDPLTGQPLPPRPATDQTVRFENAAEPGAQSPAKGRPRTLGFLMIGLGAIVLIHQVSDALARLLNIDVSGLIFPVLLVGLGLYLLRRKTV